ncbi:MAG TPA: 16S rRNA (adenine(1518)-N(6)/adenine(1519)-N(6))-dimethyltransferase RsmA [Candidatus Bathyarchaeia archaeon]
MALHRGRHRPSKRLGQNFLTDPSIAEEIVSSVSPGPLDTVLEPGPGHGTLTRILQKKASKLVAIEKDLDLATELREAFRNAPNVTILEGDILKMGESIPPFNKLVSTPPYYISSKLTLFLASRKFDIAAVVFQKEFGERLLAEPGSRDYGRLTVMARRKLDVERIRDISRTAFSPRPKVDSTLLRFTPKLGLTEIDEVLFEEMVRGIFTQRRRLSRVALVHFLRLKYGRETAREVVGRISVPDARVYELSISQLERLSLQLWRVLSDSFARDRTDDQN